VAMEDKVNWFGDLLIVGVLVCFHFMRHWEVLPPYFMRHHWYSKIFGNSFWNAVPSC